MVLSSFVEMLSLAAQTNNISQGQRCVQLSNPARAQLSGVDAVPIVATRPASETRQNDLYDILVAKDNDLLELYIGQDMLCTVRPPSTPGAETPLIQSTPTAGVGNSGGGLQADAKPQRIQTRSDSESMRNSPDEEGRRRHILNRGRSDMTASFAFGSSSAAPEVLRDAVGGRVTYCTPRWSVRCSLPFAPRTPVPSLVLHALEETLPYQLYLKILRQALLAMSRDANCSTSLRTFKLERIRQDGAADTGDHWWHALELVLRKSISNGAISHDHISPAGLHHSPSPIHRTTSRGPRGEDAWKAMLLSQDHARMSLEKSFKALQLPWEGNAQVGNNKHDGNKSRTVSQDFSNSFAAEVLHAVHAVYEDCKLDI